MDYITNNMLYVIPVIIICIFIYLYVIAPMFKKSAQQGKSIDLDELFESDDDMIQEGFASSRYDLSSNIDEGMPNPKLKKEGFVKTPARETSVNRQGGTGDDLSSDTNTSSSIPILRSDGKMVKRRRKKRNVESFQEGDVFSDIANTVKDIKRFFQDIPNKFNDLTNKLNNIPNTILGPIYNLWNEMRGAFSNLGNAINGIIGEINKGFSKIGDFFKKFKEFFEGFGKALKEYFERVFSNIYKFFLYIPSIFLWIFSYMKCGIKFLLNFPNCYGWYFLESIGKFLYIPIMFMFWYFELEKLEDQMWYYIEELDCMFHNFTGYHLIHYSDDITDRCYKCCTDDFPILPDMDFSWKYKFVFDI